MLVSPSLAPVAAPPSPVGPHTSVRPARSTLPRETWSFALALAAVLVVKAGLLPNVPW